MGENVDQGWVGWEGPRLRVLPILLTLFIGLAIIAVSFTLAIIILRHVDAQLIPRLWPLLTIAATFGIRWPPGRTRVGLAVVWGVLIGIIMLIVDHSGDLMSGITPGARAHTAVDIAGWLLFELLLVGLCEETLFRGLLLGVLQALSPSRLRIRKFSLSTAGVTIAIMFALAHVLSFATRPWPAALGQQLYAVTLGILYAWLRENSGSLLAPIIAHSLSDFVEGAAMLVLFGLLPREPDYAK